MDDPLANYIFDHCSEFFNEKERLAKNHFFGESRFNSYTSDAWKAEIKKRYLTDDPEALELLKDGWDAFVMNTAMRILLEHQDELKLNLCPKCSRIARMPEARQCRFCGHDWH